MQKVRADSTYVFTEGTCHIMHIYCEFRFHSMLMQFLLQIMYNSGTFIVLCCTFIGAGVAQSV
jgi:hypothetical protein